MVFGMNDLQAQKSLSEAIIPDFAGLQYAGSIGHISANAGYTFFKRTNLNFNYGYIPEKKGGRMHILAVKFEYKPLRIPVGRAIEIHPFNPGVFVSYTLQKSLTLGFNPPQYPKDYYFWSEALRKHIGASSEIKLLNQRLEGKVRALSLYIEANTNDLYMISWFENRTTIPFSQIFKLGYGLRLYFE